MVQVQGQGHKEENYGTIELVSDFRSFHKEYLCEIWKPYLLLYLS